jgi:hypothetical protein
MRIRAIIGTGAAAVLATAASTLIPLAASAQPATPTAKVHTYTFISLTHKEIDSSHGVADDDYDVNATGKLVGFDTIYGTYNPKTGKVDAYIAVTTTGGMLYGYATGAPNGAIFKGTVTGGVGAFRHAKGTIYARNLNAAGTRSAVTITYTIRAS